MPDDIRLPGFDVSYARVVKDWGLALADGAAMVGIKASEGNHSVDPTLSTHLAGARERAELKRVVLYHFGRSGDPVAQARRFIALVGPLRDNEVLCLDAERPLSMSDAAGAPPQTRAWLDVFCSELLGHACNQDGREVWFYGIRTWKEECADADWDLAPSLRLWGARYAFHGEDLKLPRAWSKIGWTCYQWTDGGGHGGTGIAHNTPGVLPASCDRNWWRPNGPVAPELHPAAV